MDPLSVLLILVAGIALVSGAIILTPFGLILLACAVYIWKELYPLMRRIALWSAQRQNFIPFLALAVIVWIVILIAGIATLGLFGFSGTSLLLFIWLFFTWLIVTGIAGLPIFLAIVIWVDKGVRWLWFNYRKRFWWIIPWGSEKAAKSTIVIRKPDQTKKKGRELEIYDKPKESIITTRKDFGKGGTTPQSFTSQLTSTVRDLFRLIYGR